MFCCKCGFDAGDASGYCNRCGASLSNIPPPTALAQALRRDLSARRPDIDGWLMLFAIGVTLSPLVALSRAVQNAGRPPLMVLYLVLGAVAVITSIQLWKRSPDALKMVKFYLLGVAVFGLLDLITFLNSNASGTDFEQLFLILRRLFYAVVWTLYFYRSKRVLATFGANLNFF